MVSSCRKVPGKSRQAIKQTEKIPGYTCRPVWRNSLPQVEVLKKRVICRKTYKGKRVKTYKGKRVSYEPEFSRRKNVSGSDYNRTAERRVVTIGGGTGTFALLSHLKKHPFIISAIVTMSDSGGSSRRLMDEFRRQLPLGDLRMSLVALARNGALWREIFMHRFRQQTEEETGENGKQGVSGHSLGNLVLKGLQDINNGDLLLAIADAEELLNTAGHVLPVTLTQTMICADLEDGTTICDETEIDTRGKKNTGELAAIKRLRLEPENAVACPQAVRAIRRADTIIIGPGDLYTSLLPNLLVRDIARAVRESEAEKVYVCNLMTKHGETDNYKASNFVETIHRYLGGHVDRVVVNNGPFAPEILAMYALENRVPVEIDHERLREIVPNVVIDRLNLENDSLARHDPERLVKAIFPEDV